MEALQHAVFHHIRETQDAVRSGVVEFGTVNQTTVQGRHNFATGQRVHRSAHVGVHVNRQTDGTELHALHLAHVGDGLFEPAKRLGRHGAIQVRHHIHAQRSVNFFQQRFAAAVVVPSQHHVGVHTKRRARTPQGQSGVFTVVVSHHTVASIQGALVHGFQQLESRHHGARWQHFNFEFATGHVIDFFGKVVGVFVKDVFCRPCTLETQGHGLGRGNHGCGHRASSYGSAFKQTATTRCGGGIHRYLQSLSCGMPHSERVTLLNCLGFSPVNSSRLCKCFVSDTVKLVYL